MIGVGLALVVVGIIFLFVIPWVGIPVGIVGLLLFGLWLAGFAVRRARGAQERSLRSRFAAPTHTTGRRSGST